jgi:hypothetical protein
MTSVWTLPSDISLTSCLSPAAWPAAPGASGSEYVTVLPTLPSASFISAASAWTEAGCASPAMTSERPRCAARSAATAAANGSPADPPPPPTAEATACANASICAGVIGRRWSAFAPVVVVVLSTT